MLVKLFCDRQLNVEPAVIDYLSLRMERSMEAASRVVAGVDRLALAMHRKVTRPLAAEALAALGESRSDENLNIRGVCHEGVVLSTADCWRRSRGD